MIEQIQTSVALAVVLNLAAWSSQSPPPQSPPPQTPPAAQKPPATAPPATSTTTPATPPATTPGQKPPADKPPLKQEELDQMLAPIALYPDSLLTQVLMATTYPLEIVMADRWVKAHKDLKGDPAAKALEKETWDPSVKSLVNFPPVLEMLSTKLDWTQKMGDAFIGQQKEVLDTIQTLRGKAKENGKLESDANTKVETKTEGATQVITIESANPQVIYVPTYNPTVVYGTWAYPSYPPYPYYPPGYVAGGIALGFAWGYAWGNCNWGGSNVDIDINRNTNFNGNIDRSKYKGDRANGGKGKWQHDASHRGGVPYRDSKSASQFGGRSTADASKARDSYRGRGENGGLSKPGASTRDASPGRGSGSASGATRPSTGGSSGAAKRPTQSSSGGSRGGALDGVRGGGQQARTQSSRGSSSRGGGGGRGGGGRGGRR